MKKGSKCVVLCLLVAAVFVMPLSAMENEISLIEEKNKNIVTANLNGGWLEERDGVKILHLSGSNYDMGYQHGYLLKDEIRENMRIFLGFLEQEGFPYDELLEVWDVMKDYLPQEYKEEMQGMADGLGVSFEEVAAYSMWPAVFNHLYCCGVAAWGSATSDGKLYHVRSLDWAGGFELKDSEAGTYLRENQILIVRRPKERYASVYPEFAGAICSWGGINENGIGVGETTCLTYDATFRGISAAFRMRMVLDRASTAQEAIDIMSSNRTCGWNFVISDGKIPMGYAMEQTANLLYVGTWLDSVESTHPFWEIEDVVRRSPMFISPICAATEKDRDFYDPSGLRGLLFFLIGINPHFSQWSLYRSLSEEIEMNWGALNLDTTMTMLRDVWTGKTDLVFFVMQKLGSYQAFHQWVACPETGDIVVAFADADNTACENPVHYFNLHELLEAEPP